MLTDLKNFLKIYLMEFRRNFKYYVALFLLMNLFLTVLIIPLFNWLAGLIMEISGIPFISYNNLPILITHHFLGVIGLFILLLVLLLIVYLQFAVQFYGVRLIQSGLLTFKEIRKETLKALYHLNVQSFIFFVFYFVLILPFGGYLFSTPLLTKIQIPAFTMEFFLAKWTNTLILIAFYAIVLLLGSRFLFVLPLNILKGQPIREALRESLKKTRGWKKMPYLVSFSVIRLLALLISQIAYWLMYALQLYFDHTGFALPTSIIFLSLIQIIGILVQILASVLIFSFLMHHLDYLPSGRRVEPKKFRKSFRYVAIGLAVLTILIVGVADYAYMAGLTVSRPLTISHRGVNEENGVQNTIPALKLTAKEKPDYVEMDIQETSDRQFVVMHDANLTTLAGINKSPQQMTLNELTATTVRENGHTAKIASLSAYMTAAAQIHQKLLIEIKTSPTDPDSTAALVQRLLTQYGSRIQADHDMIHSLDYNAVAAVKKDAPSISVSFILPFNIIFPQTSANAYTMEATTLDADFINQAHDQGKKVYAWTVDSAALMQEEMANDADGIITDNLTLLKQQIKKYSLYPSYSARLRMYINLLPDSGIAETD